MAKFLKENFDKKETFDFGKWKYWHLRSSENRHINILSKLDFSRRSAVQFGLKNTLKIPVFTGILMAYIGIRYLRYRSTLLTSLKPNLHEQF